MAEAGCVLPNRSAISFASPFAVEQLRRWRGLPFLANQCSLKTFEDEGLPYVLDPSRPSPPPPDLEYRLSDKCIDHVAILNRS